MMYQQCNYNIKLCTGVIKSGKIFITVYRTFQIDMKLLRSFIEVNPYTYHRVLDIASLSTHCGVIELGQRLGNGLLPPGNKPLLEPLFHLPSVRSSDINLKAMWNLILKIPLTIFCREIRSLIAYILIAYIPAANNLNWQDWKHCL